MASLFVSIFEKKTNRMIAFYYIAGKPVLENLAIEKAWYRAICEEKISIDARIDEYRFEMTGKFPYN